MGTATSSTRERLLGLLLRQRTGLTVDELGEALMISRNAVRQHLAALERDGLVATGEVRRGVGRPSQVYVLTPRGEEQFPRQYSLLSGWLLSALRESHGEAGTTQLLLQVAERLGAQHAARVQGESLAERVEAVSQLLNELGYVATAGPAEITAMNCVYHHLAAEFPEVCQLDIALIGQLTGAPVEHAECMVRGGHRCRFLLGTNTSGAQPE